MDVVVTIAMYIGWTLLGLLGFVLLLLHLPYQAKFVGEWDEERLEGDAWMGLPLRLLGVRAELGAAKQRIHVYLIGLRIYSGPFRRGRRKDPKAPPSQSGASRREKRKMKGGFLKALHTARTPYKLSLLRRISRWLFFRARLEGRFGFDDPYTTGQVEGVLTLARTLAPTLGEEVTFDYVEPAFEGRLSVSMTIWLPRIAAGMIAFLFRREGWAML